MAKRRKSSVKIPKANKERSGLTWTYLVLLAAVLASVAYVTNAVFFGAVRITPKLPPIPDSSIEKDKWGTYRPHTYFGLRLKDPKSPLFGVMWYEQPSEYTMPRIRHWCDQGDGLSRYGWVAADGRSFGRQNITEPAAAIRIDWLNSEDTWTARFTIDALVNRRYSIVLYMIAQDNNTKYRIGHHLGNIMQGTGPVLGETTIAVSSPQEKHILHSTLVWDDEVRLNQLNDLILMNTQAMESKRGLVYQLSQQKPFDEGRFAAVQLNVQNKAQIEISFSTNRNSALTGTEFDHELATRTKSFNSRFKDTFNLDNKGYTQASLDMAKVALSNMLGSVGYWHGYNKVALPKGETALYGPHSLISAVPSRPFFPRGFLWDEGFHNMLICKFDPDLTIQIMTSWLNTMNEDGWIPREMILGEESESKVPAEYVKQRTNVANPPSMFYVFDMLVHDEKIVTKHNETLSLMYPKLERWYKWLLSSQKGKKEGTFRWRGRNSTTQLELNAKTLASGLDDYPRASHPSTEEYHLDLRCWLAVCSRVMSRLSLLYGKQADHQAFSQQAVRLTDYRDLLKMHWSPQTKAFHDYGKHSRNVKLVKVMDKKNPGEYVIKRQTVSDPVLGLVEDAFGYNSLFPLMLRLMPADAPELRQLLQKIQDPEELWTDYGLRSISRKSPYYAARNTEHDPPYWRGYIWINMNYMVLSSLRHYSSIAGPNQELATTLFKDLRKNIVTNMSKQFNRTGYLWENYDDRTGEGRGSHPFTGWSSLVLLIMADEQGLAA